MEFLVDMVTTVPDGTTDAEVDERVAALITTDAIFQGLHPYTVGPAGVAEYYAAQPAGMTARYTLGETRALSDRLRFQRPRHPHRVPQCDHPPGCRRLADRPLPGVAPRLRSQR